MKNTYYKINKKLIMLPIMLVQVYLVLILVLYLFGPWEWRTGSPVWFYSFLICSQLLLYLGYIHSINSRTKINIVNAKEKNDGVVLKYLKFMIIVNLLFTILDMIHSTGMSGFSFGELVNKISLGITNPANQYQEKFGTLDTGSSALTSIITALSPFLWPVLPLSILHFKKLNFTNKILVLLTIFFESARWIAVGTNKGVIDVIIIIVSILLLKNLQDRLMKFNKIKKKSKKRIGMYCAVIILFILGLVVFSNNTQSRTHDNWTYMSINNNYTTINFDSPLMKITPEPMKSLLISMTSYLTQGYYGFSLAFGRPFIPMFGIGNSAFLMSKINQLFNIDLYQYTYQVRISDTGWGPYLNWHSFYLWIANDLSIPGTMFFMYFFGRYFGGVCFDSIVKKDSIATVLFCLMCLLFFYLPCNNQILSYPTTFMAFWVLSIYRFFYKLRIAKLGLKKVAI